MRTAREELQTSYRIHHFAHVIEGFCPMCAVPMEPSIWSGEWEGVTLLGAGWCPCCESLHVLGIYHDGENAGEMTNMHVVSIPRMRWPMCGHGEKEASNPKP